MVDMTAMAMRRTSAPSLSVVGLGDGTALTS